MSLLQKAPTGTVFNPFLSAARKGAQSGRRDEIAMAPGGRLLSESSRCSGHFNSMTGQDLFSFLLS